MIPLIDLHHGDTPASDRAILAAATGIGFMTVATPAAPDAATRAALLRIFALADHSALLRRSFRAASPNLYRGWFPLQDGVGSYKEGIDIGPDIARAMPPSDDPLEEPSALPPETALPGWRDAAAAYFLAMERLGGRIMRALARGLGLPEDCLVPAFAGGISTLRLIHYPPRTPASRAGLPLETQAMSGLAHVDSGFVTLLAQDGVPGLQAQAADGAWIDVPPGEGTLAVNFGALLERWTGGRIRATRHQVLGTGRARHSIPFFYEPRAEALISPLPLPGAPAFAPFTYGDHLWAAMTRFPEFSALAGARAPRHSSDSR